MKTKFIHLRKMRPTSMNLTTNTFKNSNLETKGGTTIAYTLDDDFNVIAYAVARCNSKDVYCKHTGRVKAQGRLKSPTHCIIPVPTPEKEFISAQQLEYLAR